MNRLQRWAMKAVGGKALESAVYPRSGSYGLDWLNAFDLKTPTDDDFAKAVKQAHRSSVVMSCVEFLVENATSTPWQLRDQDGEIVEEHPVLDLLNESAPRDGRYRAHGGVATVALSRRQRLCGDSPCALRRDGRASVHSSHRYEGRNWT